MPLSNFRVPVVTRTAAFNTRCNLSVTVLGAPARTVLLGLAAMTRAGEQQFCLVCIELQSVGGHPLADVKDAALEVIGG